MRRIIAFIIAFSISCASPQKRETPSTATPDKKKPTKEEMCADPKTPPEVLRLFCD